MLLVEHVRCAEHGDLIHRSASRDHDILTRADRRLTTIGELADPETESAHSHCPLSSHRREAWAPASQAQAGCALRGEAPAWTLLARQSTRDDSSRFRVAPKNSPPV